MDFVCGICIPDDELAVLGGRNKMSPICGPMHGVNLCEMALQCLLCLHHLTLWDGLLLLLSNCSDWIAQVLLASDALEMRFGEYARILTCGICQLILLPLYSVL